VHRYAWHEGPAKIAEVPEVVLKTQETSQNGKYDLPCNPEKYGALKSDEPGKSRNRLDFDFFPVYQI
jgi:hypothetical protein